MLQTLGCKSLDALIDKVVPEGIRVREKLNLPNPLSEEQARYKGLAGVRGRIAATLADGEGLPAHAASARYRMA